MIRYMVKNNLKLMCRNTLCLILMFLMPLGIIAALSSAFSQLMSSAYDQKAIESQYEQVIQAFLPDKNHASIQDGNTLPDSQIQLPIQELDFMPAITSSDYYGIVEIAYFNWCSLLFAAGFLSAEKKSKIGLRLRTSGLSSMQTYLGKLIPTVTFAGISTAVNMLFTHLIFHVHWGNLPFTILVMFLSTLAAVSLGLMLYSFSGNIVITIILLFICVWVFGFFGGSFESYMYSSSSDFLKQASPIYHVNRALVELSCMEKSDYVLSSSLYSSGIFLFCSAVSVLAGRLKKGGKA
nr:ABC transporter permease [uncultured Blautia sp.]